MDLPNPGRGSKKKEKEALYPTKEGKKKLPYPIVTITGKRSQGPADGRTERGGEKKKEDTETGVPIFQKRKNVRLSELSRRVAGGRPDPQKEPVA